MPARKLTEAQLDQLVEMREAGATFRAIAQALGCTAGLVQYQCLRLCAEPPNPPRPRPGIGGPVVSMRNGYPVRRFTAEDQQRANERVPDLQMTPAAVRFVSAEPLLGPIDFTHIFDPDAGSTDPWPHHVDAMTGVVSDDANGIIDGAYDPDEAPKLDWVIVGGESGLGARLTHPQWIVSIRDQCAAAGVPFFFKQWGDWVTRQHACAIGRADAVNQVVDRPFPTIMSRVGKKAAGRLLDGRTHDEMPHANS